MRTSIPMRVREVRCTYQVDESLFLRALRFLGLAVFCHYLLYPFFMVFCVAVAWFSGWVPRSWVAASVGLYVVQLAVYRPHTKGGWRNEWFRNLPIWDLLQTWLDPVWIIEEALEPNKTYIFAIAPHGIISMCRLLFEGQIWRRLFPGWGPERPRGAAATPQFLV